MPAETFRTRLLRVARLACHEWNLPTAELETWVLGRLGNELRDGLDQGFRDGSRAWFIEAKGTPEKVQALLDRMAVYAPSVDMRCLIEEPTVSARRSTSSGTGRSTSARSQWLASITSASGARRRRHSRSLRFATERQ